MSDARLLAKDRRWLMLDGSWVDEVGELTFGLDLLPFLVVRLGCSGFCCFSKLRLRMIKRPRKDSGKVNIMPPVTRAMNPVEST